MYISPLLNFDIKANYWTIDSQLAVIKPFSILYEEDKSKKKVDSSLIMWAIALFADPESRLYKSAKKTKEDIIKKDYIQDKILDFDWKDYQVHIEQYRKLYETQAERSLMNLEVKLQERDAFLLDTHYDLGNGKELDGILANTDKLYKLYDTLLERLSDEQKGGTGKGGAKESAAEKKQL